MVKNINAMYAPKVIYSACAKFGKRDKPYDRDNPRVASIYMQPHVMEFIKTWGQFIITITKK
jgi:hypothetical protein